jgi:hypothetical protein
MTTHELKCWPEFFDAIARGDKTFEVRRYDRGYQCGDLLVLRKWNPRFQGWSLYHYMNGPRYVAGADLAETLTVEVTYMLSGLGLQDGYVALAVRAVSP